MRRMELIKKRRRAGPSKMDDVEYNYTEQELDDLFGVLPGEVQDDERDWEAEEEVVQRLTEEGRVEEGLWDGDEAEGIWKEVRPGGVDIEVVGTVARWAFAHDRAWERRVMDPHCVSVVEKVMGLKNV